MSTTPQYPLVVYLNQKLCFDILASMEGGLAQLETVRTSDTEQADRTTRFSGDVGLRDAFAFVGIKLGGERNATNQTGSSREATVEKMHTPNSLFARVRQRLHDEDLVRTELLTESTPGEFVEFRARLRKSPLVANLEGMKSLAGLASIATDQQRRGSGSTGGARGQRQGSKVQPAKRDADEGIRWMNILLDELNGSGSVDLVGNTVGSEELTVVLTMDPAFLTALSMSDLVDGEYRVLGKLIRVLDAETDETINLLRKTSLAIVPEETLTELTAGLSSLRDQGLELPAATTYVNGPALQLIPIAVFA
jgi:hypothetical protein